jgi:RNA polymerase primary sigma factor
MSRTKRATGNQRNQIWTDEELALVKRERDAGKSWRDIAMQLGRTAMAVERQGNRCGVKRDGRKPKHSLVSIEERNRLVVEHIGLAHDYAPHWLGVSSLDLDDLLQEARIGLMRAAELWEPSRGAFSTYAYVRMRQAIARAIDERGQMIRIPGHVAPHTRRVKRVAHQLEAELRRAPTIEEIAVAASLSLPDAELAYHAAVANVSLDEPLPITDETGSGITLGDVLHSDMDTAETAIARSLSDDIARALAVLPARERLILELRYGLADGIEHAWSAIGKRFGISSQAAQQSADTALRRLRQAGALKYLAEHSAA